ncbi:MAG: ABC-F family ATP-binding cassette domain-containing protein [Caldilineaceae bacterium]|nr:ABC-F family ATP-binding cassette domain-containing protein [Caldilineaceae bacterium]
MSLLTLSNLSRSFGDIDIFVGLSGSIPNDAKIGLVGPNGIGKTTLLRILAGLDAPTTGQVTAASGTRIGYLRQEAMEAFAERDNTVHGEMLTVFSGLREQEDALRRLEQRMAHDGATEALLAEYSRIQERFERAGGYDYEVRIKQILQGLGFSDARWNLPLSQLSGGQKTRALLARLLLERPDLLILDEPTNHLDVETIEWLENLLRTWEGALLIVSHDRYFLDKVVNRIWEMSRTGMEEYRGNYSAYLLQRQERWARRDAEFQAIREKFLRELDYVKRNIARDSTTNMAKGRLKRLIREVRVVQAGGLQALNTKSWSRVMDEIDISSAKWNVADVEGAIKGLQSPIIRPPELNMRLKTEQRSGMIVLRTTPLRIGYPGTPLFTSEPIELHRGECAALIGSNGTGKTTFLRTLMEDIEPLDGTVRFGASLKLGYFAQAHDALNPENTVLDELLNHKHMLLGPARSYLAQYLFRGDDVYKLVGSLSGGERARLALGILALEEANFLLLDEPTNHLDIPAQEILQEVLEHFPGTILLVSHDRYLIDGLASQIWTLNAGEMHVFTGGYSAYIAARDRAREKAQTAVTMERREEKEDRRSARARQNAERKRQRALEEMESEIHRLEEEAARLEQAMADAGHAQDLDEMQRLSKRYDAAHAALEAKMEAWTELAAAEPAV